MLVEVSVPILLGSGTDYSFQSCCILGIAIKLNSWQWNMSKCDLCCVSQREKFSLLVYSLSFPAPLPQKSLGVGAVIQSQQDILHGNTLWHCWSSKGKTGFGSTIGKESSSNLKIEPSIPVLCMAMWIRHLKKKCVWAIILLSQFYSKSESVSRLVVSDSSRPHGL